MTARSSPRAGRCRSASDTCFCVGKRRHSVSNLARSRAPTSSRRAPFLDIADIRDATVELSVTSSDRATSRGVIGGAPVVDGRLRTSSRAKQDLGSRSAKCRRRGKAVFLDRLRATPKHGRFVAFAFRIHKQVLVADACHVAGIGCSLPGTLALIQYCGLRAMADRSFLVADAARLLGSEPSKCSSIACPADIAHPADAA
jgi:hypothetical protein